jgi:hypothetical protein
MKKFILLIEGSIDGGHDADIGIERNVLITAETVRLARKSAKVALEEIRNEYRTRDLNYLEGTLAEIVMVAKLNLARSAQPGVPAKKAVAEHFELS